MERKRKSTQAKRGSRKTTSNKRYQQVFQNEPLVNESPSEEVSVGYDENISHCNEITEEESTTTGDDEEPVASMTREELIEAVEKLKKELALSSEMIVAAKTEFITNKRKDGDDRGFLQDDVIEKLRSVETVLKDNLKRYTIGIVFPVQKFNQEESIFKHLCTKAVNDSKVMLPEGCKANDFACAFWREMRDNMNHARQNSNNSARIKFIGMFQSGWKV
jgi:hypothetical protein